MTKITSILLAAASLAILSSCKNSDYKTTPSGIRYRIISSGNNPQVKRGEILKLHYSQKLKDSVMFTSFNSIPTYAKVDSVGPIYNPVEVLPFLHKGDSVIVVQLADSLLKNVPPGSPPPPFKKGDQITISIKVLDVLKTDELAQADQMAEIKTETEREQTTIGNYLTSKNISTQKTPKGVYVDIQKPGEGTPVDSGKYVSVMYTGKSFPSGKVFETNENKPPIQFTINSGQVIPGWDEGLKMLKKGGKATLYIPATLAYGPQPGPGGKPFENLIFDVHVVDVADAAPAQPPMQMPQDPRSQSQQNQNPQNPNSGQR